MAAHYSVSGHRIDKMIIGYRGKGNVRDIMYV
jgi:hypothetical protein